MTLPGSAVGAGGALTDGVKELGPPGDTAFSVGDGAGALVVVVGVVLDGDFSPDLPHAVSVPIPTIASPPAKSAICRVKRPDIMISPYFVCRLILALLAGPAVNQPTPEGPRTLKISHHASYCIANFATGENALAGISVATARRRAVVL
jgi:hypothetical protein